MENPYPANWPQFFTATIQDWKHLLKEDKFKDVIMNSLIFLVKNKKVRVSAYVIMNNHIHLIWQAMTGNTLHDVQVSLKKFTSQQFIKLLETEESLNSYQVNVADRKYSFWKRNSLGIELFSETVFYQKLEYIHNNPVRAGLCNFPWEYKYSSALFYEKAVDHFGILEQ
jgi:REP element-mobilizing transposase RayT